MITDPYEQLLRDLTRERHNQGGWRPKPPSDDGQMIKPDPDAERHRQVLADYVRYPQGSAESVDKRLGVGDPPCHLRSVGAKLIKRSA